MKTKGIYCIEGLWNPDDISDRSTVLPILELLEKRETCNFIYHDCATYEELLFLISTWRKKAVSNKYPILYLAFHGKEERIFVGKETAVTLELISELLKEKCYGKVIYFGSCSTLNTDERNIKRFLDKTDAIAAIGYKTEVDWLQATACDLFVFDALQKDLLDSKGIKNIHDKIISDYGNLHRLLGLRVVINDRQHFPRKRKKTK